MHPGSDCATRAAPVSAGQQVVIDRGFGRIVRILVAFGATCAWSAAAPLARRSCIAILQ